jgi:hypothetical protein
MKTRNAMVREDKYRKMQVKSIILIITSMPKANQYKVSVPEPCHESWDGMTPAEQGRLCNSCREIVMDFSAMSDAEMIRYMLTHKNVCGRISREQESRVLVGEPPQHWSAAALYQRIAASMLLLASFTERVFAQPQRTPVQQQSARRTGALPLADISIKGTLNYFINADAYRENVVLRADTLLLTVVPDEHGAFEFHLPQRYLNTEVWVGTDNKSPKVEVIPQKITLYTLQTNVYLRQMPRAEKQAELQREEITTKGRMYMGPEYNDRVRYTFWRRLTRPFRKR